MLELEFTFLLKAFPPTFLEELKSEHYQKIKAKKEMIDCYFPPEITHPKIRLRQNGKKFELTKKEPLSAEDASIQQEQTISLTESEFTFFSQLKGKKVHKTRYLYEYTSWEVAEIDVFQWELLWLVVVDFEFSNINKKAHFKKPEWCGADITQDDFIAWGMIAGKKYEDIQSSLSKYNYEPLFLK